MQNTFNIRIDNHLKQDVYRNSNNTHVNKNYRNEKSRSKNKYKYNIDANFNDNCLSSAAHTYYNNIRNSIEKDLTDIDTSQINDNNNTNINAITNTENDDMKNKTINSISITNEPNIALIDHELDQLSQISQNQLQIQSNLLGKQNQIQDDIIQAQAEFNSNQCDIDLGLDLLDFDQLICSNIEHAAAQAISTNMWIYLTQALQLGKYIQDKCQSNIMPLNSDNPFQKYNQLILYLAQSYTNLYSTHTSTVNSLIQTHSNNIGSLQQAHTQQLNTLTESYTHQLSKLSQKHQAEMEELLASHQSYRKLMEEQCNMIALDRDLERSKILNQIQDGKIKIRDVEREAKAMKQRYQHVIEKLNRELNNKENLLNQNTHKLSTLLSKLQKYQYQLQQKCALIDLYENELQQAMLELSNTSNTSQQKFAIMIAQYQGQVQRLRTILCTYGRVIDNQAKAIGIYQGYLSNKTVQKEKDSPIKLIENQYCQLSYFVQQPNLNKITLPSLASLLSSLTSLLTSHSQSRISYQNLSHKYAQFLKQTEQKLQQYRSKSSKQEKDATELNKTINSLQQQLASKSEEIENLLGLVRSGLERERIAGEKDRAKIGGLEKQIEAKDIRIQELLTTNREQSVQFDKHITTLTLQIQSLKEAISTLNYIIKLQKQQAEKQAQLLAQQKDKEREKNIQQRQKCKQIKQKQPIDVLIVQQMIDKTYEIRLQNTKMKDRIDELMKMYESKCVQIEQLLRQIESNNSKYIIFQNKYVQQTKILQNKISQLQRSIKQKQQQNYNIQQSLKSKTQLYSQSISTSNENLENQKKKRSTLQEQNKHLQIKLSQIQYMAQNKSMTSNFMLEQYMMNYERMELYRLQIGVLGKIVGNAKQKSMEKERKYKELAVQCNHEEIKIAEEQVHQSENLQIGLNQVNTIRQSSRYGNRRQSAQSIGRLVQKNKAKVIYEQNSLKQKSNSPQKIEQLNKTCKIRQNSQIQPCTSPESNSQKQKSQIEQLNILINFMINLLKGYTRNGIRQYCWLTSQGGQYLTKIQTQKNIKQKYANFQRVRTLTQKNQICKKLVKDYEGILGFYFKQLDLLQEFKIGMKLSRGNIIQVDAENQDTMISVGMWESFEKENSQCVYSTCNKSRHAQSMYQRTK